MFDLVVTGGTVISAERESKMDVGITDGTIRALAAPDTLEGTETVDADGHLVLPGFIDAHVHAKLSIGEHTTVDEFSDLTRAAAFAGSTTIFPFAIPGPAETPLQAHRRRLRSAEENAYVDYGFHGCITNADGSSADTVAKLAERGVRSIKGFMVYGDRLRLDDGELRDVMEAVTDEGGVMLVHAENDAIITRLVERQVARDSTEYSVHPDTHPPVTETIAMWTVFELVAETGCPTIIVHASTEGTQQIVEAAEERGLPLLVETCPHYLCLTDSRYHSENGEQYVCSPPLRSEEHQQALWEMLVDGSINFVNSDHCGYTTEQKRRNRDDVTRIPNGLPGIETCNVLLFSEGVVKGQLSRERFVELVATNPAKILGLYPRKGAITVGADADLVIIDPAHTWSLEDEELHMASDYTPFDGMEVTGVPKTVLVRGEPVISDRSLIGTPSVGEYVCELTDRDVPDIGIE